jgi:Mn2+/Fe2+ NRAMP family transporter
MKPTSPTDSGRDLMTIYTEELTTSQQKPMSKKEQYKQKLMEGRRVMMKFLKFIGPGFMVAVAYIDPGNYATDAAAGAESRFGLLFMVLLSNLIAIFFQILCIKLGSVSGGTLAENCREYMPRWMYLIMYIISEAAIIATDLAEVCLDLLLQPEICDY